MGTGRKRNSKSTPGTDSPGRSHINKGLKEVRGQATKASGKKAFPAEGRTGAKT